MEFAAFRSTRQAPLEPKTMLLTSPLTHELVVRDYRPACHWKDDEVLDALNECRAKGDVMGASALFGRFNAEHKSFFGYDFRDRTVESEPPKGPVQEAVVLNCTRAAQYYELIRARAR